VTKCNYYNTQSTYLIEVNLYSGSNKEWTETLNNAVKIELEGD